MVVHREITEKIINVLLSIKCAYALEPHQIQGLDTVKILPVVQVCVASNALIVTLTAKIPLLSNSGW